MTRRPTALLSAYHKDDLEAFGRGLVARDWDLLAIVCPDHRIWMSSWTARIAKRSV